MKSARLFLSTILATGGAGMTACAETAPPAASAGLVQPVADVTVQPVAAPAPSPAVAAIRQAAEPSAAIDAYAKAQLTERDSAAVEAAYLERMVQFGLPEMADTQAQDLIRRDPNNALAWAVAGYMSGKRGDMATAMADTAFAAQRLPDDPFVQRSAGQLLAWYDSEGSASSLPPGARQSAQTIRNAMASRPAFAEAYKGALDAIKQPGTQPGATGAVTSPDVAAAPPATAPQTGPAEPYGYSAGSTYYPEPNYYTDYGYYGAAYPYYSYYYPPYYGGYPWWPNYWWWGGSFWWPSFGFFFAFDDEHHHHHHHDDFDHHHHDDFHHHDGDFHHGHDPVVNNHVFAGNHAASHQFANSGMRSGATFGTRSGAAGNTMAAPRTMTPSVTRSPMTSAGRVGSATPRGSVTTVTPHGSVTSPMRSSPQVVRPNTGSSWAGAGNFRTPSNGGQFHSAPSGGHFYSAPHSFAPSGGGFHGGSGGFHGGGGFSGGGGFHGGGGGGGHGGGGGGHR